MPLPRKPPVIIPGQRKEFTAGIFKGAMRKLVMTATLTLWARIVGIYGQHDH
jgi:hypothetical protein